MCCSVLQCVGLMHVCECMMMVLFETDLVMDTAPAREREKEREREREREKERKEEKKRERK